MFNKTRKYIFFPVLRCCNSASITVKFPHGMGSYSRNQWHTLLVCRQDGFRLRRVRGAELRRHTALGHAASRWDALLRWVEKH